jgi:hypothetical protein
MQTVTVTIAMLVWFQVKHYVADYLLQPGWVLGGKGDMRKSGGYVHAGVHAVASVPAYLIAGLGAVEIVLFVAVEFVIHYLVDFTKAGLSARNPAGPATWRYWALHGADQFVHQLTYAGLIFFAQMLAIGAGAA